MNAVSLFAVPDAARARIAEREQRRLNVFQEDAARFATRPEEYAAQERNAGIRDSNQLRVAGEHGRAHYVFVRSFMRQVRILGLSYAAIPGQPYELGGDL